MRRNARAIVVKDGKLLVLKRSRGGHKFYVIPGGNIDEGETAEQAAERETYEETSIKARVLREVFSEEATDFGITKYFLCEYLTGEPQLHQDSGELKDTLKGENTYQPMWVDIDELAEIGLLPTAVAAQLVHDLEFGFSSESRIINATKEKL
jgi:8-oxo-dGTP pyrophosphatase MutT (NUDIX family)